MQTLGQELGQAEPGESSGEKDQCAPERGAHGGRRLIQGISSFRKRPLHRLLASSLLNCTTHHAPHAARLGHPPCGPSHGPGPRGSLSLLIRGMGTVLATSQGSRERAFRGPPIQAPLHDGKMWAQERRNQNHSRSTLSPRWS